MSAADIFVRVAKRCLHQTGSDLWRKWIEVEMRKVEQFHGQLLAALRAQDDEVSRHTLAMKELTSRLSLLRQQCCHEMVRVSSQDPPTCKHCGHVEGDG